MVNGGEQKPVAVMGPRVRGRGRRPTTGQRLLRSAGRRSSAGYVAAGLAVLALAGAWALGLAGCTAGGPGYGLMGEASGSALAKMRQSPGEISRLRGNAHYYKLMGRAELGLREMELAHQQNPDNLEIVNLLAQHYEELGKFEAARQLYQEALTRHGSHPAIVNNLGFSYYQEGRWQEAEACFRQALADDASNVAARNNLGLLYCRLGRQNEARLLWQDAEGAAAADLKIGQVLAALGMSDRPVYARRTESGPPVTEATLASAPKTVVSPVPSPAPVRENTLAKAATPKVSTPPAPKPAPVATRPQPEPVKLTSPDPAKVIVGQAPATANSLAPRVQPKKLAPRLAAKPPAEASGPVAVQPRDKAQPQAAPLQKGSAVGGSEPAPQAKRQGSQAPLTATELAGAAIEVRNGNGTRNLANQTRSLLRREGFTVAKIGNHVHFGAAKTMIYYRPGSEKVARAVARKVFPEAELAPSPKLNPDMDIKVLLGHDLQENPRFMARLHEEAPEAAAVAKSLPPAGQLPAAKTEPQQHLAGRQEPLKTNQSKAAEPQPLTPKPQAPMAQPYAALTASPLTSAELADTAIEVRNGNGTRHLARQTRSLLRQEGFSVAMIGNHVDFGATKTMVYYRPGAEKIAHAVARTLFPEAGLETSQKLKKGMDVKILLGADLLERPQLMARLVAEAR
jgi:hypothetical protein